MQKLIPFLWFDSQAEEAANYYVSIFKNSKIENVSRYGDAGPGPKGAAMVVEFQLEGQQFMAINGFSTTESTPENTPRQGSIALYIDCETQSEVDRLWDTLAEGGRKVQCGWLVDKYGFTWNIVPSGLGEVLGGDDPQKAARAMKAMMGMEKLDIDALRRAYEGEPV